MKKNSKIFCMLMPLVINFSLVSSPSIAMIDGSNSEKLQAPSPWELLMGASTTIFRYLYSTIIIFDLQKKEEEFPTDIKSIDASLDQILDQINDIKQMFEYIDLNTVPNLDDKDLAFLYVGFAKCLDYIEDMLKYFGNMQRLTEILSDIRKKVEAVLDNENIKSAGSNLSDSQLELWEKQMDIVFAKRSN